MCNLHVLLLAFQRQSSGSVDRETLLVIFVGIIAFFFLALIAGLGAAVLYALKLKRDVLKAINSVKLTVQEKARPVVASTNQFVREMSPKIKSITDDAVEISHTIRAQVTDIDSTLSDVTAKARAQAERVNGMVSSTLTSTSNVVSSVEKGVKLPFREVAGVVAGIKAGWNVLTQPGTPAVKSETKRAARHVESWEQEVARDAVTASHVNQVKPTDLRSTEDGVRAAFIERERVAAQSGEELLTSPVGAAVEAGSVDQHEPAVSTSGEIPRRRTDL